MQKLSTVLIALACIGTFANAQAVDTTDWSKHEMKDMGRAVNQMQNCMVNIDDVEQNRFETAMTKMENEVVDLCRSGQTAKAQQKVLQFSRKIQSSKIFHEVKNCTGDMRKQGFLPPMPILELDETGNSSQQICDRYVK